MPITKSNEFEQSRSVLRSKKKTLKEAGKGNRPNKAEYLDHDYWQLLWALDLMGPNNPRALCHGLFALMVMAFGMRPNKDSYNLLWGDVELKEERQATGEYCFLYYIMCKNCS